MNDVHVEATSEAADRLADQGAPKERDPGDGGERRDVVDRHALVLGRVLAELTGYEVDVVPTFSQPSSPPEHVDGSSVPYPENAERALDGWLGHGDG